MKRKGVSESESWERREKKELNTSFIIRFAFLVPFVVELLFSLSSRARMQILKKARRTNSAFAAGKTLPHVSTRIRESRMLLI